MYGLLPAPKTPAGLQRKHCQMKPVAPGCLLLRAGSYAAGPALPAQPWPFVAEKHDNIKRSNIYPLRARQSS